MKNFIKLLSVVVMVAMVGFASCTGGGEDDVIKDIDGNILYSVQSTEIKVGTINNLTTLTLVADTTETKATYNAETGIYTVKLCFTDKTYSYIEFTFSEVEDQGFWDIISFDWSNSYFTEFTSGYVTHFKKGKKTVFFNFTATKTLKDDKYNYRDIKGYEIVLSRK
jgi:hypothetical protein